MKNCTKVTCDHFGLEENRCLECDGQSCYENNGNNFYYFSKDCPWRNKLKCKALYLSIKDKCERENCAVLYFMSRIKKS